MTEDEVYPLRAGHSGKVPPEVAKAAWWINDFDGWNWQAIRQYLREHGVSGEECDSLTMMGVRMRCQAAAPKIVLSLNGTIATHTGETTRIEGVQSPASGGKTIRPKVNAKGSQTEKLVGYLTLHHRYGNGVVGNYHPAESSNIAGESKAKPSTVSDFLRREFPYAGSPRDGYVQACRGQAALLHWFMVKHGESLPVRNADLGEYDEDTIREKY